MKKTALLFPGLDALYVSSKMKRWLELSEVKDCVSLASSELSRHTGQDENLEKLITESARPHLDDFDRTTVVLAAIQVGIATALGKSERWDYVLGCSHGDVARSVAAGIFPLEDAIGIVWTFAQIRKLCPDGRTANVRTVDGSALLDEQIEWLKAQGATVSRWSTHHATIAAITDVIDGVAAVSRERNLKVKPVFPFAVHSPVMNVLGEKFIELAPRWRLKEPRWPVFSSVSARFLNGVDEIRSDAILGMTSSIQWTRSLESLRHEHGVTRFLNIGPSNALTGWALGQMQEKTNGEDVRIENSWELLGA